MGSIEWMLIPDAKYKPVSEGNTEMGNVRVNLSLCFLLPLSFQLPLLRLYFLWPCFSVRKTSDAMQFNPHCWHSNKLKHFTARANGPRKATLFCSQAPGHSLHNKEQLQTKYLEITHQGTGTSYLREYFQKPGWDLLEKILSCQLW